jgi:hypothetical protein
MKKLLGIVVLGLLLSGNANAVWIKGTGPFLKFSSHEVLVDYYSEYELDGLCDYWSRSKDWSKFGREKNRKAIKEVLEKQGHDKFICMKLESP